MEPDRHVAAIPYPGRGHINPMLNLCRLLLASKDGARLLITVIVTEEWRGLIEPAGSAQAAPMPPNLRFSTIPNVLPAERSRGADFAGFVEAVRTKMGEPVERLVERLEPPVDFVVADSILPWAAGLSKRRRLPAASVWTESAAVLWAVLRFRHLDADGQLSVGFSGTEDKALAYLPRFPTPYFARMLSTKSDLDVLRIMLQRFYWITTTPQILLLSSFHELESPAVNALNSKTSLPIYPFGPPIPYMSLTDPPLESDTKSSYFKWLDAQPNRSVLYISLGSFLSISSAQVEEMIMGLNASGVRYLWVGRDENQQVGGKVNGEVGIVVSWCEQLRVLCHPSVGGFLTHCGWNSTLEGIYAGVPMLTFPLFLDQYSNSKQIVDDWKIGVMLKDEAATEERVVGREEVARIVRKVMDLDAEESKGLRRRAAELKGRCREAVAEGGSSSTNLHAFVHDIISVK